MSEETKNKAIVILFNMLTGSGVTHEKCAEFVDGVVGLAQDQSSAASVKADCDHTRIMPECPKCAGLTPAQRAMEHPASSNEAVVLEMRPCNGPHGAPTRNDPNCVWCEHIDPRPIHEQYADDGVTVIAPKPPESAALVLFNQISAGAQYDDSTVRITRTEFLDLKDALVAEAKAHAEEVAQLTKARDFHYAAANKYCAEVEQLRCEREHLSEGIASWRRVCERITNERNAAVKIAADLIVELGYWTKWHPALEVTRLRAETALKAFKGNN